MEDNILAKDKLNEILDPKSMTMPNK